MKQIALTYILFSSLLAHGQFMKGDKYLGGSISLYTQRAPTNGMNTSNSSTNSFSVSPSLGFLLNDKWAIGGQVGYSYSDTKYSDGLTYWAENKSISGSTGLFTQRYFKLADKFYFSLIGYTNFYRTTRTSITTFTVTTPEGPSSGTTESKSPSYELSVGITPGFLFVPNPHWAFGAGIGTINYVFSKNLSTGENINTTNVNYGSISFGLYYYIRKGGQTSN